LAAYPLVDSLSQVHKTYIRRTSLKVRNPKDAPTESELIVLKIAWIYFENLCESQS
jgi:hypothetical protein